MSREFERFETAIQKGRLTHEELVALKARIDVELVKSQRVLIGFVLDRSSSMNSVREATISGFNEWLETAKREMPHALVTLTVFNDETDVQYSNTPLRDVPMLSEETYVPNGMTALYDAVGATIRSMEDEVRTGSKFDKVLLIIQTDGQENSSRRFNFGQVRDLIQSHQKNDEWQVVALGADMDAWGQFQSWGILRGNTHSYSSANTRDTFGLLANATVNYAAGEAAVMDGFFEDSNTGG